MDYDTFNRLFPMPLVEVEDKEEKGEDESESTDKPKFKKNTKVDLEPEEEYIDNSAEIR